MYSSGYVHVYVFADVIDDCRETPVTEGIYISPSNPLITKKRRARSAVECVMGCSDPLTCPSLFSDTEGRNEYLTTGFLDLCTINLNN